MHITFEENITHEIVKDISKPDLTVCSSGNNPFSHTGYAVISLLLSYCISLSDILRLIG